MASSKTTKAKIAKMSFALVYSLYLSKVEKKGRTKTELNAVISWLSGFDDRKIQTMIDEDANFETFFDEADLNPNVVMIKGSVYGVPIEEIDDPLVQKSRYLDLLVDELAKGKKMEKILRGT